MEALTGAGLGSQSLKGGKVEVSEVGEEGEEEEEMETGPSFLLRSWMPSWMLTMPRCVPDF